MALLGRVDAPGVNDTNIFKKTPVAWDSPTMWASLSMALLEQGDNCGENDTNIFKNISCTGSNVHRNL